MSFNSWQFLALAAVVYPLYFRLSHAGQNWLLLIASYVFYGAWDVRFLLLLAGSTVLDYFVALRLEETSDPVLRKRWLAVSLAGNLGTLAFFKYFGFFVESATAALEALGVPASHLRLDIVLPVGISFYTFQTLSYAIDVYRGELRATKSLRDFALFVAYFPQLVAGPIERATRLLPQIINPRRVSMEQVSMGLWLISWGLFKKVAIADNLAIIVDRTFSANSGASGAEYLVAIYAFAYQIYCDFSGYSDIARGLAFLMGIDLMVNFRRPYLATDPRDFWRRWHISLSTWLRDYLYIPLGGSRGGVLSTYRALFLTMVLGGLWHGAKWTFVMWGVYHGLLLIVHRVWTERGGARMPDTFFGTAVSRVVMFHLICAGWLLFRADSMAQVGVVLTAMTSAASMGALGIKGLAAILLVSVFLGWVERYEDSPRAWPPVWQAATVALLWIGVILGPPSSTQAFLYFQF
jgi:alginate O-acetyltransferase complex protein AlgI